MLLVKHTDRGCTEERITPWIVCIRATQEQLPSASFTIDALPIVSTSYVITLT